MHDTLILKSGRPITIRDLNGADTHKASLLLNDLNITNQSLLHINIGLAYAALSVVSYVPKVNPQSKKYEINDMIPMDSLKDSKCLSNFWSKFTMQEQNEISAYVTEKNFTETPISQEEVEQSVQVYKDENLGK